MKRFGPLIIVLVLAALVTFLVYDRMVRRAPLPEGLIQANGRLEGDHVTITTKFAGRVRTLSAHEGDTVKTGDVLAELDDTQLRAQVAQAEERVRAIEAQIAAARAALAVLEGEVPLDIEWAEQELSRTESALAEAQARQQVCELDARRMREAGLSDAASKEEIEKAELALQICIRQVEAATAQRRQARSRLDNARLGDRRIAQRKADIDALAAQREQAAAALAEARSVLDDFVLRSPADGTVVTRIANLGEVVPPGAPLFDVVNLDELYLKVYVPETEIGRVRLGSEAGIYTDAHPGRMFPGKVRYISPRAEFTPKEVQTPDERVKLVFAVKIYLDENPEHQLSPGLPADAVIRWKEGVEFQPPRW